MLGALCLPPTNSARGQGEESLNLVLQDQAARIATIERVAPAVVCVLGADFSGGGSGVLIDPAGYGLTNFHVVAGILGKRRGWGALSDGTRYELEVLGIDPTGDVAMFRLLGRDDFPFARLGDSDAVQIGDRVMAMGNPFGLSTDYKPTVTMGMVTGVHRYQWGVGRNLVYSDCIQVDASINPGNSGGPLFNLRGEIIGINGRISVNTRGRFNVGFGYAISSNQIAMFVPALSAGHLARHGTLLATVEDRHGLIFIEVAPGGAAARAGITPGDTLRSVDAVPIRSANRFVSVMGTYPANRHILLEIVRNDKPQTVRVRLDPVNPDLKQPFTPDVRINQRETRRVIGAFQAEVKAHGPTGLGSLAWDVLRLKPGEGAPKRFRAAASREGPFRLDAIRTDGSIGKTIRCNGSTGEARTRKDRAWFTLNTDQLLVAAAFFAAYRIMLVPAEELDLTAITHVGGDRLFPMAGQRADEAFEVEDAAVLAWQLSDDLSAHLLFGSRSRLLRRIVMADDPSGMTITVDFRDYHERKGAWLPETVEVRGPHLMFIFTQSNWALSRP